MDGSEDINFDKIFKRMIFAMKLNRCHPDIPRDRKWICQFIAIHGFFSSVLVLLIYCIIFVDIKNKDWTQACANGMLSIVFCVVTLKYCVMLRYQSLLKGLMDEIVTDYEAANLSSLTEKQIVLDYAKRGKKVADMWVVLSMFGPILFMAKTFFLMAYYSMKGEFELVAIYELTYPSPIEEVKKEPALYVFLYIMFLYCACYCAVMYSAMAALGPVLMLHCCGQLQLVRRSLLSIFNDNDTENMVSNKLTAIIKHLQKIYSFVERIQKSFNILYELCLKASAFGLPVAFYQVIEAYHDGNLRIEFITIIIGGMAICSIPCYYSDELMDTGEEVRLAVYMCGWENHLFKFKRLRTTLLLIHSRASRKIAIRTIFRTVSLDALTDVYHQAYAIFNLINATTSR